MSSQKTDAIRFCVLACLSVCVCAVCSALCMCVICMWMVRSIQTSQYIVWSINCRYRHSNGPLKDSIWNKLPNEWARETEFDCISGAKNNRKLLFYINEQQHELIETGGQVISTYAILIQCDTLAQFARRSHWFLLFDSAYGMCRMQRRLIFYLFVYLNSTGMAHSDLFNI